MIARLSTGDRDRHILVIAGPIWLGDKSSVTKRVIERLYARSHLLNEAGQRSEWEAGCRFDFENPDYR